MSYDVHIGQHGLNYTSNGSSFFYDHMVEGLFRIDGLSGREASHVLAACFESLNQTYVRDGDDAMRSKYSGLTEQLIFLGRILGLCTENPDEVVRVYA